MRGFAGEFSGVTMGVDYCEFETGEIMSSCTNLSNASVTGLRSPYGIQRRLVKPVCYWCLAISIECTHTPPLALWQSSLRVAIVDVRFEGDVGDGWIVVLSWQD